MVFKILLKIRIRTLTINKKMKQKILKLMKKKEKLKTHVAINGAVHNVRLVPFLQNGCVGVFCSLVVFY